jgi:hypothetical protein
MCVLLLRSSLDTCEVGANYTVSAKTKLKKEQFSTASIMEHDEEM